MRGPLVRGGAVWQLVGLITRRSQVQILPPLPITSIGNSAPEAEAVPVKLASFEALAKALDAAGARYLVAGGLAVGAHGYLRFTKDVDLVIQLVPDNIERTFSALTSLGYRPNVPIDVKQFANAELRDGWVRDKGMQVLQFWSDAHKETSVDVFVTEPFSFDDEYAQALVTFLNPDLPIRFVSLPTLIRMKEEANRPQDRADIDHLRARQQDDAKR
jgi:hypothetical protein